MICVEDYLNPNICLEKRIKICDELIMLTKQRLEKYPEIVYPKEYNFYSCRLHSYELIRCRLIDALFEQKILRR